MYIFTVEKSSPKIWNIMEIEKAAQSKQVNQWTKIRPIWSPCPEPMQTNRIF
jgi:hypothetical protein